MCLNYDMNNIITITLCLESSKQKTDPKNLQ